MKVIDDAVTAAVLTRALTVVCGESAMSDLTVVGINCALNGARRTDNHGLNLALPLVENRQPLILTSFLSKADFNTNRKFHFLTGHICCEFVRLPASPAEFLEAYENIRIRLNPDPRDGDYRWSDDELRLSLLDIRDLESEQRTLAHDLHHAQSSAQVSSWLERANAIGYSGSFEEIVAAVMAASLPSYTPFANRRFSGTFVDLEGTLFVEGELNKEMLQRVNHHSVGCINLWTGGDVSAMAEICRRRKLPWMVISKWLFRGATVEQAFDDLSEEELASQYGVAVELLCEA